MLFLCFSATNPRLQSLTACNKAQRLHSANTHNVPLFIAITCNYAFKFFTRGKQMPFLPCCIVTQSALQLHFVAGKKRQKEERKPFICSDAFRTRILYLHTAIRATHAYTPTSNKANCSSSNSMAPISVGGGKLVTHTDKGELGSRSGFYISI